MTLPIKLKLPDIYLDEYARYVAISQDKDRSTMGDVIFTSTSSGITYNTATSGSYSNQGQAGLALMLYNENPTLKDYIFDDETYGFLRTTVNTAETDISTLQSETNQLDWQTATVVDREIQVSRPTNLKSVKFQLEADIVSGTVINISTDGGVSSLPLKDIDEVDILELEKGFYEVIADATFFTLRPSGLKYPIGLNSEIFKTQQTTDATTSRLNISGSGYVHCIGSFGNTASPYCKLILDGVDVFKGFSKGVFPMILRFETSLEFLDNSSAYEILYSLDSSKKEFGKGLLQKYSQRNAISNNLLLDISGSGWLSSIGGLTEDTGYGFTIEIDGVEVILNKQFKPSPVNIRFESSLKIKSESTVQAFYSYVLD